MNNFLPQVSYLWLVRNERTPILLCWTSLVIGRKRLGGPGWVRCSVNKSDYYYEQFNFRLAPQTFMLVTSSNSLPEGQPHLFTFVSPWISGVFLNQAFSSDLKNRCQQVNIGRYTSIQGGSSSAEHRANWPAVSETSPSICPAVFIFSSDSLSQEKLKNALLKNLTDLLHKNLMKPLQSLSWHPWASKFHFFSIEGYLKTLLHTCTPRTLESVPLKPKLPPTSYNQLQENILKRLNYNSF